MAGDVPKSVARLAAIAHALGRTAPRRKSAAPDGRRPLPSLWLFTDPDRTPDILAAARRLPEGAGVVLRTFGRPEIRAMAAALAILAKRRKLTLLVGADERLAVAIKADGLHLPQRSLDKLPRLRARHPAWRFTVAVHDAGALRRAALAGAEAAFLSPILLSLSPSAGPALGPTRAANLIRTTDIPVYGLGGINAASAMRLRGVGFSGLAGVGFAGAP